jgi:hypothetical protein
VAAPFRAPVGPVQVPAQQFQQRPVTFGEIAAAPEGEWAVPVAGPKTLHASADVFSRDILPEPMCLPAAVETGERRDVTAHHTCQIAEQRVRQPGWAAEGVGHGLGAAVGTQGVEVEA